MVNDKAILIVLAYVIGFTTAFIAFGLTNVNYEGYSKTAYYTNSSENKKFQVSGSIRGTREVSTRTASDGLYALVNGHERVLSAQAITATEGHEGYHHDIVLTDVSPDARYIYFCSQQVAANEMCDSFIYDISSDVVYRVKYSDSQVRLPVSNPDVSWTTDSRLAIDGHISASVPWQIVD